MADTPASAGKSHVFRRVVLRAVAGNGFLFQVSSGAPNKPVHPLPAEKMKKKKARKR